MKGVLVLSFKVKKELVLNNTMAHYNYVAYSMESFDIAILDALIIIGMWLFYLVFVYSQGIANLVPLIILTGIYVVVSLILNYRIYILMSIDIIENKTIKKNLMIYKIREERVPAYRFAHSKVHKYFNPNLNVGRYILRCYDRNGRSVNLRIILSGKKSFRIYRTLMENKNFVDIKYLKNSRVVISFEQLYEKIENKINTVPDNVLEELNQTI